MEWITKHFSDLNIEELYEIVKSRNEVFIGEQEVKEQDLDDRDKDCYHLFAMDNGRVVAYCRILKTGVAYKDPSIGRVLVTRSHRRSGLANKMMVKAIEFIKNELDEDNITLSAQEYVVNLYEGLGFRRKSEVYMEAGIPHIKMRYEG
ncbi:GNAT family N-acetyltransferase [Clostridium folliculivorans]|uniref:Acetyltransferase n=1 Tax=Clostridium folliculivorans TaxID=2886038 RepID=A0A9W5Y3X4_9CLOT|nr:GNAT family N-acetyltransferase [Clostridium folliculivorans]GKU26007.1 acetyltransferase [Clostridium folliculivorans]GKU28093.1 acetyltransferase [Clostridium folliculivorans]